MGLSESMRIFLQLEIEIKLITLKVLLSLRTWAIWGRSRMIQLFIPISFVTCWVPALISIVLFLNSIECK